MKMCLQCHTEFIGHKKSQKFCSAPCHAKFKTIGFVIGSHGYRLMFLPEHPAATKAGYVPEHRLVMMQHLGRLLTREEIVHHINANKLDNRLENLQIISRSDIGKAPKLNTECPMCHHRYRIA